LFRLGVVGKEVSDDQTRAAARQHQTQQFPTRPRAHLHLVVVPANPKREAAVDHMLHLVARALERARREQRVVGRVERDGSKFLPVPHVGVFRQDLVEGDFPLNTRQHARATPLRSTAKLTPLKSSTGTLISSAISLFPLNISPVRLQQHAGTAMLAKTRS